MRITRRGRDRPRSNVWAGKLTPLVENCVTVDICIPTSAQCPELSVGDEAAGEFQECFADVGSSFPPGPQAWEAVQPGKTPLHDPAVGAQPGTVPGTAAGDRGHDVAGADLVAVDVVVVAAVGEQRVRLAAGTSYPAADRWDRVEQGQQLGVVVAVLP